MHKKLSIIIPLGPKEKALFTLIKGLSYLPVDLEIIIVYATSEKDHFIIPLKSSIGKILKQKNVHWIRSEAGRAQQMNSGGRQSKREYLWFLHADSKINIRMYESLIRSLKNKPNALHYFQLAFLNDGPLRMLRVNEVGVRLRSGLLWMPYGDQGFCIRKKLFIDLGSYPEKEKYGEDHIFVWRARQAGIPIVCTGEKLYTSARKYRDFGWLKTTVNYNILWAKQALPEAKKYLQSRGII